MKTNVGAALLLFVAAMDPVLAGTAQEVKYGVVQEARTFTDSTSVTSSSTSSSASGHRQGLRTLSAAAIGGAVGNQFGGGTGQDIATATGAVAGARASRRQAAETNTTAASSAGQQMVELTVKTDDGKLISVVQPSTPDLSFAKGDKVRVLTSGTNTQVDKAK